MVGPGGDTATFFLDENIVLVPELDGARAISDNLHEFIERVPGLFNTCDIYITTKRRLSSDMIYDQAENIRWSKSL